MINNPSRSFINGSDTESFTYEPGRKPYNWMPHDCGLESSWMTLNVMVFANSEFHAKTIVADMLEHLIDCRRRFEEYRKSRNEEIIGKGVEHLERYIENISSWVFTECPINQPYKITWASNDNFL